ncbi:MAG: DUF4157 domain-containing protein [Myxococcota bacterium]
MREARPVAELVRAAERLLQRGHPPAAVERVVASWVRALGPGHATRDVVRQLGVHGLGRQVVRRLDAQARADRADLAATVGDAPRVSLRVRDEAWFEHLRDEAGAARWALPADVRLEVTPMAASALAPLPPGVHAIQRDASDGRDAGARGPRVADILRRLGAGRALPDEAQAELAQRLAALGRPLDLAAVRVHDGAEAEKLCRELRANAFAVGRHIVFGSGRYHPDDASGLALIAHELTHVWQQASGLVAPHARREDPALEADARGVAAAVARAPAPESSAAASAVDPRGAVAPDAPQRDADRDAGRDAATRDAKPRGQNREALLAEARQYIARTGARPSAVFVVAQRIDAFDAELRARGSWPIHGEVPLEPGFWLDGAVDCESWSGLTAERVVALSGGRADALWVVGPRHGCGDGGRSAPKAF